MSAWKMLRPLLFMLLMAGSQVRADPVTDLKAIAEAAQSDTAQTELKRVHKLVEDEDWRANFNQRSWEWHLLSTQITFYVVVGTVLFGLFLSFLQFTRQERLYRRKAKSGTDKAAEASPQASSIKLGANGIEVNSQVIGLLILSFSLAFFYLYVKDIYPMTDSAGKPLNKPAANEAAATDNAHAPILGS